MHALYKSKGKVHPRKGHEGPEGEKSYSSTLYNLSTGWGLVANSTPRSFYPGKEPVPPV